MHASSQLRTLAWVVAILSAVLPCRSQAPLREQLQSVGVPVDSFSRAELDEAVDGAGASKQPYVFFVYLRTNGDLLTGIPHLVRYDQDTGVILRSDLQLKKEDPYCCGSPDGIKFLDDYLLLYFHYNPSASSILVLDKDLKLLRSLDGFNLKKIATNQIVLTENMIHFAPTHPERLQWVDLSKDVALEIYPLQNDALRNRFIHDLETRIPAECKQAGQSCNYDLIEEGCVYLGGDGRTQFAFECGRSASYQVKEGDESVPYSTDSAIYLYAHNPKGWEYCAQAITEDERKVLEDKKEQGYDKIKSRCTPNLAVVPDIDE